MKGPTMSIFRRNPRTFAEYMATPAKRGQRDAILAMCDEYERRAKWTNEEWEAFFADLAAGKAKIVP